MTQFGEVRAGIQTPCGPEELRLFECEHCGQSQRLTSGYHDNYYHTKVIPGIACRSCNKRRDGTVETAEPIAS